MIRFMISASTSVATGGWVVIVSVGVSVAGGICIVLRGDMEKWRHWGRVELW